MERKISWVDIVIIILFILAVYFILTRIFGHSASDLSIIVTLFSLLVSIISKAINILFNLNREVGELKVRTINSFSKVKDDFELIKEDTKLIKKKLKIIK